MTWNGPCVISFNNLVLKNQLEICYRSKRFNVSISKVTRVGRKVPSGTLQW